MQELGRDVAVAAVEQEARKRYALARRPQPRRAQALGNVHYRQCHDLGTIC
jgi:hypothetical protein